MTAAAVGIMLLTGLMAAAAQVLLKSSALIKGRKKPEDYLNPRVIGAYGILGLTLLLNAWALRWLDYKMAIALGSLAYIHVIILSKKYFNENIRVNQIAGMALIAAGIAVFHF